ncbi:hypothetical protein K438DRAFT_855441 [Mycena galopus ATCC 62051]|nr:hypothetical protein K438DRAFT_855441 [Mycena galopus ATCC 62051]
MWTRVLRLPVHKVSAGVHSVSFRLYSSRNSKITAYLRNLSSFTRDPIWGLVMALNSPQSTSLSEALNASNVSLDEFARWRPSLYASDIEKALEHKSAPNHPSWLVLYLAAFKVRTPQHASGSLIDLSFAHTETAPPTIQAPLFVLSMMHLARFDLVLPMQRVIDAFLLVPITEHQDVHFNHLLSAMTSIRYRSRQSGDNAVKVLRAMEARQLRLWHRVCSALLEDRYAALQLTSYLRRRMTALGVVPTAPQLEQYLRVYAADGAIHDAERYAAAIRRLGAPPDRASAAANSNNRANTFLVRTQPDTASAFDFLLGLTMKSTKQPFLVPRPTSHPRPLLGKRSVNAHDWTAALSVAAHDTAIDAKSLVRLLMRTRPPTAEFRSGLVSHTVLIRGLLLRREWELAYTYWTKLARSGMRLDEHALAAGLQATTLSQRPAEAFALLEAYAARPSPSSSASPYRNHLKTAVPLRVSTGTINALMRALRAILRPDLIFRLWDAMGPLYAVRPSPETLRILLDAAQLPHLLDDSIPGQLALLALKNPFRARDPGLDPNPKSTPSRSRGELVAEISAQAQAPYRSGVWRGRPAAETAARVFAQAVLGAPERAHIARLPAPAHAVRAHPETGGPPALIAFDDLFPPNATKRASSPATPFRGRRLSASASAAPFPELLVLRERDWAAYIRLLGMARLAPDIARALAWMRACRARPTHETLGVALAFWGEVSVRVGGDGEYGRLVQWCKAWLASGGRRRRRSWRIRRRSESGSGGTSTSGSGSGSEGREVPDERTVGLWRAAIARVRAQRRETIGRGRGQGRFLDEVKLWVVDKGALWDEMGEEERERRKRKRERNRRKRERDRERKWKEEESRFENT